MRFTTERGRRVRSNILRRRSNCQKITAHQYSGFICTSSRWLSENCWLYWSLGIRWNERRGVHSEFVHPSYRWNGKECSQMYRSYHIWWSQQCPESWWPYWSQIPTRVGYARSRTRHFSFLSRHIQTSTIWDVEKHQSTHIPVFR